MGVPLAPNFVTRNEIQKDLNTTNHYMVNMGRERYPKGIAIYRILAFLNKIKEAKTVSD